MTDWAPPPPPPPVVDDIPQSRFEVRITAALMATTNLIGSPWMLNWEGEFLVIVNLVVAAWLSVAVEIVETLLRWRRQVRASRAVGG